MCITLLSIHSKHHHSALTVLVHHCCLPQAAMEWCLLVQQAAMYLPWPETLLSLRQFRVEEDSQQRLAFRGPR